jgi:hypothetical protein
MNVAGVEIAVLAIVHPATLTAVQTRMGSSTVSPPPSPPVHRRARLFSVANGMPHGDETLTKPLWPATRTISMHCRRSLVSSSAPSQARLVVSTCRVEELLYKERSFLKNHI